MFGVKFMVYDSFFCWYYVKGGGLQFQVIWYVFYVYVDLVQGVI